MFIISQLLLFSGVARDNKQCVIYTAVGLQHNYCSIHDYDVTKPAGQERECPCCIALFRICAEAMFTDNADKTEDARKTTHLVQT